MLGQEKEDWSFSFVSSISQNLDDEDIYEPPDIELCRSGSGECLPHSKHSPQYIETHKCRLPLLKYLWKKSLLTNMHCSFSDVSSVCVCPIP